MVCIDSDIIVDFLRKDAKAINLLKKIEEREGGLKTTAINSFEIFKGVSRHANRGKYEEVVHFLSQFTVLDLTFGISQKAAEIFEQLRSKGELIDTGDILIAAIVMSNNETLITRNRKHFGRIPGLNIESFSEEKNV